MGFAVVDLTGSADWIQATALPVAFARWLKAQDGEIQAG